MRKTNLTILTVLISFLIIQFNVNAQIRNRTIITGVPDENATEVYLTKVDYVNPNVPETIIEKVLNNSFRFELDIDQPQLYRLYTNADTLPSWTTKEFQKLLNYNGFHAFNCQGYYQQLAEIFIQPNDSAHIQMNFNKRTGKNISIYTGNSSGENKFLADYRFKANTKRGWWPYTFFGMGGEYKKRTPERVIKLSNREKNRYQNYIDKQKTLSNIFLDILTNDNNVTAFQLASNVMNRIDSSNVKLFFTKANDFHVYKEFHSNKLDFRPIYVFDRSAFVYAELLTNYQFNFINKQFKRFNAFSYEKYKASMEILTGSIAELYGAKTITWMINDNYDREKMEKIILDYKSRFPNSKYSDLFIHTAENSDITATDIRPSR